MQVVVQLLKHSSLFVDLEDHWQKSIWKMWTLTTRLITCW